MNGAEQLKGNFGKSLGGGGGGGGGYKIKKKSDLRGGGCHGRDFFQLPPLFGYIV